MGQLGNGTMGQWENGTWDNGTTPPPPFHCGGQGTWEIGGPKGGQGTREIGAPCYTTPRQIILFRPPTHNAD